MEERWSVCVWGGAPAAAAAAAAAQHLKGWLVVCTSRFCLLCLQVECGNECVRVALLCEGGRAKGGKRGLGKGSKGRAEMARGKCYASVLSCAEQKDGRASPGRRACGER